MTDMYESKQEVQSTKIARAKKLHEERQAKGGFRKKLEEKLKKLRKDDPNIYPLA